MTEYIASVSFGKDSLAMLLMLIEKKYPLTEVVFYDTGKEFDCIYKIRDKMLPILKQKSIKYTELKPRNSFDFYFSEKPVKRKNGTVGKGYSWCGGICRWGTTEKLKAIESYCKDKIEYVGIAIDEKERLEKKRNRKKFFPLSEWGMTEKDCLELCYQHGFNWQENGIELYSILDRVSCWCCANKNLKELKNYFLYLPEYWERLKKMQAKTTRPMKKNYSVFDLENKFKGEEKNGR